MRSRPGAVQQIIEHPSDNSKLLLLYDFLAVVWDLRAKAVVFRCHTKEAVCGVSWLSDGKQFMAGHRNGTLSVWNAKDGKLARSLAPHSRQADGAPCHAIRHLQWLSGKDYAWTIFSGGLPLQDSESSNSITILSGNDGLQVVNFDGRIVDFCCLTSTPFVDETQDPHTLVVLLEEGLEVVDLQSPVHPRYRIPYTTTLPSSPVTCILYEGDISSDLYGQLCSVGTKQLDEFACTLSFPITGGLGSVMVNDVYDLLVTGHADGTIRFWDMSSVSLMPTYTLHTACWFEPLRIAHHSEEQPEQETATISSQQQAEAVEQKKDDPPPKECPHTELTSDLSKETGQEESPQPQESTASQTEAGSSLEHQPKEEQCTGEEDQKEDQPLKSEKQEEVQEGEDPIQKDATAATSGAVATPTVEQATDVASAKGGDAEGVSSVDGAEPCPPLEDFEFPFAIHHVSLCTDSATLSFSSLSSYAVLCKLSTLPKEVLVPSAQVCLEDGWHHWRDGLKKSQSGSRLAQKAQKDGRPVRWSIYHGVRQLPTGFQPDVCIQFVSPNGYLDPVPVSCLQYCHALDVLGVGSRTGLGVVDILQQSILLSSSATLLSRLIGKGRKRARSPAKPDETSTDHGGASEKAAKRGMTKRLTFFGKSKRKSAPDMQPVSMPEGETAAEKMEAGEQDMGIEIPPATGGQWAVDGGQADLAADPDGSVAGEPEAVQCLQFAMTYSVEDEYVAHPSLWLCTSAGAVYGLTLKVVPPAEGQLSPSVSWDGRATVLHVSSSPLISLGILDEQGQIISSPSMPLRSIGDQSSGTEPEAASAEGRSQTPSSERKAHYLVVTSEERAWVYALPSHGREKHRLAEDTAVVKSSVMGVAGGATCLVSLTEDGRLLVHGLPSLTLLLDFQFYIPESVTFLRVVRTFACAHGGQALYMTSPSQIQRLSLMSDNILKLPDSLPDMYTLKQLPERAQRGFFASFFGSMPEQVDRTELFGKSVASQSVATRKVMPGGMEGLAIQGGGGASGDGVHAAVSKARRELDERGDKLDELSQKTADMSMHASEFSRQAKALADKYRDTPWWKVL